MHLYISLIKGSTLDITLAFAFILGMYSPNSLSMNTIFVSLSNLLLYLYIRYFYGISLLEGKNTVIYAVIIG
jgi:hypothetical protein